GGDGGGARHDGGAQLRVDEGVVRDVVAREPEEHGYGLAGVGAGERGGQADVVAGHGVRDETAAELHAGGAVVGLVVSGGACDLEGQRLDAGRAHGQFGQDVVVGVGTGQGQRDDDAAAGIVAVLPGVARRQPQVAVEDLELARDVGVDVDVVAGDERGRVERGGDGGSRRAVVGLVGEGEAGEADLARLDRERGGRGAREAAAGRDGHQVDADVAGCVGERGRVVGREVGVGGAFGGGRVGE